VYVCCFRFELKFAALRHVSSINLICEVQVFLRLSGGIDWLSFGVLHKFDDSLSPEDKDKGISTRPCYMQCYFVVQMTRPCSREDDEAHIGTPRDFADFSCGRVVGSVFLNELWIFSSPFRGVIRK
jgi:hypothetical protein